MDLHKPVYKDGSHVLVNVRLALHVERTNRHHNLLLAKMNVRVLGIIRGAKRVLGIAVIDVVSQSFALVAVRVG